MNHAHLTTDVQTCPKLLKILKGIYVTFRLVCHTRDVNPHRSRSEHFRPSPAAKHVFVSQGETMGNP